MFCSKCGKELNEGTVFCTGCGNKIESVNAEPVINSVPVKKKSNKLLMFLLIIVTLGFLTSLTFLIINLIGDKGSSSSSSLSNTTWYASDDSEMIFEDSTLYWYKNDYDHNDNYYKGTYKFYRGEDAVKFITGDLSTYGVTESELKGIFKRSDSYDESNFVVIDITYDEFVMDGKNQKMTRPHAPLYGFILKNDTYLDVANMNTGTYYKFTKK